MSAERPRFLSFSEGVGSVKSRLQRRGVLECKRQKALLAWLRTGLDATFIHSVSATTFHLKCRPMSNYTLLRTNHCASFADSAMPFSNRMLTLPSFLEVFGSFPTNCGTIILTNILRVRELECRGLKLHFGAGISYSVIV
jgi:hypothetical protein